MVLPTSSTRPLTRRSFLAKSTLGLAGLGCHSLSMAEDAAIKPVLRVGLLTDIHYADKESANTRFYRQSLSKMDEAVKHFNATNPDLVVELGDLIDRAENVEQEITWLKSIESRYAELKSPRHYVLGNHCVDTLTKKEFAEHTQAKATYYSIEIKGIRFIMLDACFKEDGTPYERKNFNWQDSKIPDHELEWLKAELEKSKTPTIVFAHHRLDLDEKHSVKNAAAVRDIFEKAGNVAAVFQGHSHKNDHQEIAGIHYTTLVAMVEGATAEDNGYAMLDIMPDTALRLHGFRHQINRELAA